MGKASYDVLIDDKALNSKDASSLEDIKLFLGSNEQ
jgi:hypothetical protein